MVALHSAYRQRALPRKGGEMEPALWEPSAQEHCNPVLEGGSALADSAALPLAVLMQIADADAQHSTAQHQHSKA